MAALVKATVPENHVSTGLHSEYLSQDISSKAVSLWHGRMIIVMQDGGTNQQGEVKPADNG